VTEIQSKQMEIDDLALCDHGQDQAQAPQNFPVQLTEVERWVTD